jgi:hypothetical protein
MSASPRRTSVRRDRAAQEAAGASALIPRAVRTVAPDHFDRVLRGVDDGLAAVDLDPVFVWLAIGLAIYFPFSRKRSALA